MSRFVDNKVENTGHYVWTIYRKSSDGGDHHYIASFRNRKLCVEYLTLRHQECMFEIGNREAADSLWGAQHFFFEQEYALDRRTLSEKFEPVSSRWDYTI